MLFPTPNKPALTPAYPKFNPPSTAPPPIAPPKDSSKPNPFDFGHVMPIDNANRPPQDILKSANNPKPAQTSPIPVLNSQTGDPLPPPRPAGTSVPDILGKMYLSNFSGDYFMTGPGAVIDGVKILGNTIKDKVDNLLNRGKKDEPEDNGIDTKTLLIVGGIALGAILLVK